MIKFRQKDFSLFSSMLTRAGKFAGYGASITGLGAGMRIGFRKASEGSGKKTTINDWGPEAFHSTVVGAGLGALIGALIGAGEWAITKYDRATTVNVRLMKSVVDALKKAGLKEGQNFTRDPKEASRMKTKVCIAVSRVDGDTKIAINQISDGKLKDINNDLIKNIPNTSAVTERQSDRFNDIVITSISDSSADVGLIAGIAERYIHSGYPVYLIEVG